MSKDLHTYRKSYEKNTLTIENSNTDPFEQFKHWFKEVEEAQGVEEVNAMTLATVEPDGSPKSRVVLLKSYDSKGFIFYTNYTSEKGIALAHNPKVCISFFWPNLERQVIIKGHASKISKEESTQYFHKRPHGSQLGAWASPQSKVIKNRSVLEDNLSELKDKYPEGQVPKPENWGGYRIAPTKFEFWQGRPNRLHDRIVYEQDTLSWKRKRLAP